MSAEQQDAFRMASEGAPEITGGIRVNFDREGLEFLLQPITGGQPGSREGHALSAVFVRGEAAELFKFSDGALRVQQCAQWPGLKK
jgi:hypothetical protein